MADEDDAVKFQSHPILNFEAGNPGKMTDIPSNNCEISSQRNSADAEIQLGQWHSSTFQFSANPALDFGGVVVKGQDSQIRPDPFL